MANSTSTHAQSGLLENMTIADVKAFQPEVALITIGSTEPHGPHLPYGTDTIILAGVTEEAVRRANAEGARVLRLPPIPISNNVNFKGFPFACRISVETLMAVIMDLVTFLREEGIRKIVIVNGHGGNDCSIKASLRQLFDKFQHEAFICSCGAGNFAPEEHKRLFHDGSPHAGDFETSMVQHLAPDLIVHSELRTNEMRQPVISALRTREAAWVRPWHLFLPSSAGGQPQLSSAEKGREYLSACGGGLANFLIELSREPWHPEFPYEAKPPGDSSKTK